MVYNYNQGRGIVFIIQNINPSQQNQEKKLEMFVQVVMGNITNYEEIDASIFVLPLHINEGVLLSTINTVRGLNDRINK